MLRLPLKTGTRIISPEPPDRDRKVLLTVSIGFCRMLHRIRFFFSPQPASGAFFHGIMEN